MQSEVGFCSRELKGIVMRRIAVLLGFALLLLLPTSVAAAECQFVLGFAMLRDLIGHEIVGECLENEHHGANGDALQQTAGGLLVWRKADNWTAFTDGYRTWINGPNGLVQRLNTERFEWEHDYAPGGGIATPTPTPTPVATATPIPTSTPKPTATPAPASTPTLTELAMAAAWYQDGLSASSEHQALRTLQRIDKSNPQFSKRCLLGLGYSIVTCSRMKQLVIRHIAEIGARLPKFASNIVELPWIADSVSRLGKGGRLVP